MRVLYLTRYYLKRMARHRGALPVALALPIVAGLLHIILPEARLSQVCAWGCPVACALLAGGWVWIQESIDRSLGLTDGIKNTPLSASQIIASRIAAGIAILAAQSVVLAVMLVTR